MIYLFTGSPGAGKTLNGIKFLLETPEFQNRPVYAYNINGLSVDGWQEISEDQALDWMQLPDKSVIFVDEAQKIWRCAKVGAPVLPSIQALEEHRHRGFDFVLTTQSPSLVHTNVKKLIFKHYHFERIAGSSFVKRYEWSHCVGDPNSRSERSTAITNTIKFDKSIFNKYKSAELHTAVKKFPWQLYFLIILVIVLGIFFFWYMPHRLQHKPLLDNSSPITASPVANNSASFSGLEHHVLTPFEYMQQRQPRVAGLPWTAPVYDHLMQARSVPKPAACVASKDRCLCHTQQGTRLAISEPMCRDIVKNGWYDESMPDRDSDELQDRPREPENAQALARERSEQPAAL